MVRYRTFQLRRGPRPEARVHVPRPEGARTAVGQLADQGRGSLHVRAEGDPGQPRQDRLPLLALLGGAHRTTARRGAA